MSRSRRRKYSRKEPRRVIVSLEIAEKKRQKWKSGEEPVLREQLSKIYVFPWNLFRSLGDSRNFKVFTVTTRDTGEISPRYSQRPEELLRGEIVKSPPVESDGVKTEKGQARRAGRETGPSLFSAGRVLIAQMFPNNATTKSSAFRSTANNGINLNCLASVYTHLHDSDFRRAN